MTTNQPTPASTPLSAYVRQHDHATCEFELERAELARALAPIGDALQRWLEYRRRSHS